MTGVDFFVRGTPRAQGHKRAFVNRHTGRAAIVENNPTEHRSWREAVAAEARQWTVHNGGDWPLANTPVLVTLTFGLARPASAPKRRRTWPINLRSGDLDTLARSVCDSLTGVMLADDAAIVGLAVRKDWGVPGVRVQLWPLVDPDETWIPEWTANTTASNGGAAPSNAPPDAAARRP